MKKIGLLPLIIIAIIIGIPAGMYSPLWLMRIFSTFGSLFSSYLGFIIPLLIIGFVSAAIADVGQKAGKLLVITGLLAYGFTLLAGFTSYGVSTLAFPSMISPDMYLAQEASEQTVTPYFTMDMTPIMGVLSALVLAFVLGLGTARLGNESLKRGLEGLKEVIAWVIKASIIPLLPFYIFTIFAGMAYEGSIWPMLVSFGKVISVIFALHIFILLLQYAIASLVAGGNPLKSLWTMMPAYFTALGTSSSAATIPVTLKRTQMLGVRPDISGFTVPLCATIHMSGSTLKIVACALALMVMKGMPYDVGMFASFIAMLGISIIAAPGVPGGAIFASLGILSSILGFTAEDNALMIALYITMDSFGTACNVTGDGAISLIVNRIFRSESAPDTAPAADE